MGRKVNTFTVEEALDLFDRAGNDDQRIEILEQLTLVNLHKFARVKGVALKAGIKKAVAINLIIEELSQLQEAEPVETEAREPEQLNTQEAELSYDDAAELLNHANSIPEFERILNLCSQAALIKMCGEHEGAKIDYNSCDRETLIKALAQCLGLSAMWADNRRKQLEELRETKPKFKPKFSDDELAYMPLKRLRKEAGVTITQLAQAVHLSKDTCYKIEAYGNGSFENTAKIRAYLVGCIKQEYP